VRASATQIDPGTIRAFAADRLPDYMLPDPITVLDRLPLTPTARSTGEHSPHQHR
jgi:hypothetical protein